MIGLIVAYTKNRVIGSEGRIPWRIKGEQRRFKELTTGNVVIMAGNPMRKSDIPFPTVIRWWYLPRQTMKRKTALR